MPLLSDIDGSGSCWQRFRGSRAWLALALVLLLTLGFPAVSLAQDGQTAVRLDGRVLFRVSDTPAAPSLERAARVEQRLRALLENLSIPVQAQVVSSAEGRLISVSGATVVTITQDDAENSVTTIDRLAAEWQGVIERELERALQQRLGFGGRFLAETRGALGAAFSIMAESANEIIPRVLAAILILGSFILLAWMIVWVLRRLLRAFVPDRTTENLIRQLTYYSIVLMGLLVSAGALGFSPESVVTGLGLTGLVLGFALKDILSNFISGLLILGLRPFELGDQIVVGATEGSVERIQLRATQIRTYDGRVALVPNAEVFTSRIVNNTADPIRRGNVTIRVPFNADLDTLMQQLGAATRGSAGVLSDRPITTRVDEVEIDFVALDIGFWTDSRRSDFKDTSSAVKRAAVSTLVAAGHAPEDPSIRRIVQMGRSVDDSQDH